ncbi:MAG: serpin family protein, partial [Candidatus Celaenobacter polaris]|nr:serpin family protein [Candidatus Celaenobacter polaris]
INNWVEKKTHDKIKELIKPPMLTIDTRLVLCNAIYFKGNWLSQFDKEKTYNRDFYVSPDTTMLVPMMYQQTRLKYKYFEQFCALELPYEGNDLSMIIFLPLEIDGLAEFEDHLTADSAHAWIDELMKVDEEKVLVSIPKFKTTCEFELSKVLYDMGMPDAFSLPPADFSGMTGLNDLFISKVVHKAYVEVNEEGTEAAAATAVIMERGYIEPNTFQADHPFMFLIRENLTGSILFIGRIVDPTK